MVSLDIHFKNNVIILSACKLGLAMTGVGGGGGGAAWGENLQILPLTTCFSEALGSHS